MWTSSRLLTYWHRVRGPGILPINGLLIQWQNSWLLTSPLGFDSLAIHQLWKENELPTFKTLYLLVAMVPFHSLFPTF